MINVLISRIFHQRQTKSFSFNPYWNFECCKSYCLMHFLSHYRSNAFILNSFYFSISVMRLFVDFVWIHFIRGFYFISIRYLIFTKCAIIVDFIFYFSFFRLITESSRHTSYSIWNWTQKIVNDKKRNKLKLNWVKL